MSDLEDTAAVVPSRSFDKALSAFAESLQQAVIGLIERISQNPYAGSLVQRCQLHPPNNYQTFQYRSPRGFLLSWDVHVAKTHVPFPAGIEIVLTDLRLCPPSDDANENWLAKPFY
jgi:hypothetical protein